MTGNDDLRILSREHQRSQNQSDLRSLESAEGNGARCYRESLRSFRVVQTKIRRGPIAPSHNVLQGANHLAARLLNTAEPQQFREKSDDLARALFRIRPDHFLNTKTPW